MFEINIKGTEYQFRFGLGFVREIDKTAKMKDETGQEHNAGLQYAVAALMDEDMIKVVDILDIANKTEKPRVTRNALDEYIEDENTDTSRLCEEILDFFKRGNATKKKTEAVIEIVEKAKEEQA